MGLLIPFKVKIFRWVWQLIKPTLLKRSLSLWLGVVFFLTNTVLITRPTLAALGPRLPRLVTPQMLPSQMPPVSPDLARTIHHIKNNTPPSKSVIIIQDVHLNAQSQKNISHILRTLQEHQSTPLLVGIEGAAQFLNFSPYRYIPRPDLLIDLATKYMETGKLLGSSFAALTQLHPRLWIVGVETPSLYRQNVEAYLKSQPIRRQLKQDLNDLKIELIRNKRQLLNPTLRKIFNIIQNYRLENFSLGKSINLLIEQAPTLSPSFFAVSVKPFFR